MTEPKRRYWCHHCKKEFETIPKPNADVVCSECQSTFCEMLNQGQAETNTQQANQASQEDSLMVSEPSEAQEEPENSEPGAQQNNEPGAQQNVANPERGGVRLIVDIHEQTMYHVFNIRRPRLAGETEDADTERAIEASLNDPVYSFTSY